MSREFAVPGWTPRLETAYYVVHGLLHLCGYDDLSPADRRAMRRREQTVLRRLGLPPAPRGRLRREVS
jgi:probable rRNA maturation factor